MKPRGTIATACTPAAGKLGDHVVDVGLEPRLARRARARLVDELPRDAVGAREPRPRPRPSRTSATARCCAAYAPPSPRSRCRSSPSRGPERSASAVGMLCVENSTRTASGAMPSARNPLTASRTPSTNGCTKPGWSKNCRTLSIVTVSVEPGLGEHAREVLAVLPAARERRVGARRQTQESGVAGGCGIRHRLVEVRRPVAVAPVHRQVDAAGGELRLQCGLQGTVLRVDGAHPAEVAVVVRDLFEALVGDAAPARDVAEEGDDVVLTLGTAEAGEQEAVVGDGLLHIGGAGCCGRARRTGRRAAREESPLHPTPGARDSVTRSVLSPAAGIGWDGCHRCQQR